MTDIHEGFCLPGCDTVLPGRYTPTFHKNQSPPSRDDEDSRFSLKRPRVYQTIWLHIPKKLVLVFSNADVQFMGKIQFFKMLKQIHTHAHTVFETVL